MRWWLCSLLLCSCRLECSNLPVKYVFIPLPIRLQAVEPVDQRDNEREACELHVRNLQNEVESLHEYCPTNLVW